MNFDFDLIAIGGGSGGIACARRAARYGARCAVVEYDRLGGTCVNRGCVPKKIMWHASDLAHTLADCSGYNFEIEQKGFDWQALVAKREAYIQRLNGIYQSNLEKDDIKILRGHGKLLDRNTVEVDGQQYTAERILLAPGGEPSIPDIPGAELGMSSDGFFELQSLPKRVAVVGAGYIAVELAGVLHGLGSEVSLIIRRDHFLRDFDRMLSDNLQEAMLDSGLSLITETSLARVEKQDDGLVLTTTYGSSHSGFDKLIWAIGRTPLTTNIGLQAAGVQCDQRGYIVTDEWQATSVDNIFAIGDVTGRAELTPVAIAAGRRLASRLWYSVIRRLAVSD